MRITIFVTDDAMQFNLTGENPHEHKFLQVLGAYSGEVFVHAGLDIMNTQGGYLRNFDREDATAITIKKHKTPLEEGK